MDRSIPHVRDIFAPYRASSESHRSTTEVCVYDYSPGSRRRNLSSASSDFIDTDHSDSTDNEYNNGQHSGKQDRRGRSPENNRHASGRRSSSGGNNQQRTNRNNQENMQNNNRETYSSKTLTDRDIRHLERHLSMKKTIRKQISRNLAQAFVEDPKLLENPPEPPKSEAKADNKNVNSFTLTRAKVARSSEPTFLDMLKDKSRESDSGHSSPAHPGPEDGQMDFEEDFVRISEVVEPEKKSFWKKLGFKGKGKR